MRSFYLFKQKPFLSLSIGALAVLIISFVAFDKYILEVTIGEYRQWIYILFGLLILYYSLALTRAITFLSQSWLNLYYIMAIIVSVLALFTFIIDFSTINEIARLYYEGFGFYGEQRMLLISLLIKFMALLVSALAAVKVNKEP